MFSPVGNQPPSVYWRRRVFVLGSAVLLVLLVILTVRVVTGGDGGPSEAAGGSPSGLSPTAPGGSTPAASTPSTAGSSGSSRPSSSASPRPSSSGAGSSVMPAACKAADLAVQSVVAKTAYKVGSQPVLALQVTNTGSRPCVQDLADKQVVLRVYNGESRVWGSHDCEIQPGTDERTLPAGQAVRVTITWSGRTSQEGCKGARQRVGAGTYTLYSQLSGKSGKATQFTIG